MDFTKKFCKAKNKLFELNTFCKIDKLYFIHKFLNILGPSFDIIYAIFSETYFLLSIAIVTFGKIVMATKKEEQ